MTNEPQHSNSPKNEIGVQRRSIFASFWDTAHKPTHKLEHRNVDADNMYTIVWDDSLDLSNACRIRRRSDDKPKINAFHSMSSLTLSSLSSDSNASRSSIETAGSASTHTIGKSVHFSPHATIVEYVNGDQAQQWYSKSEMEQFRLETVTLGLRYLEQHPEQISLYRKTNLDPVTNTRRRRPMLCLPTFLTSQEEESDSALQQQQRQRQQLRQLLASLAFETEGN